MSNVEKSVNMFIFSNMEVLQHVQENIISEGATVQLYQKQNNAALSIPQLVTAVMGPPLWLQDVKNYDE